jgi:transcriptional regulator with XRE-family HTH domain
MNGYPLEVTSGTNLLSEAIKAIRLKRGLKAATIAEKMGMPQRSYELFEAGGGKITIDRIWAFAEATDSDPFALILGPMFGSAEFAVDCADTKLPLIMMMMLEDFARDRSGEIPFLDPPTMISGFESVFRSLAAKLDDHERFLTDWLEGRTGSIGAEAIRHRLARRRRT